MKKMLTQIFVFALAVAPTALAQDASHPSNVEIGGKLGIGIYPTDSRFQFDLSHSADPGLRIWSTGTGSPKIALRPSVGWQKQWNMILESSTHYFKFVQGGGGEEPAMVFDGPKVGIGSPPWNGSLSLTSSTLPLFHIQALNGTNPEIRLRPDSGWADQWWMRLDATDGNSLKFIHGVGTDTPALTLSDDDVVVGDEISAAVIEIRGEGNDLAEGFAVHGEEKPGMVVSISTENAGDMVISTEAYDRKVAGIISGAGDKKVGIQLGHAEEVARGELTPVALTGRVWCYVDASFSAVEPGDLLTTSNTPGHAMKVLDHSMAQGATIGKAMTPLAEGKGLVLTLVALQ